MTLPADHPMLLSAADLLRDAGYAASPRLLEGVDTPLLVAESPYALCVLVAGDSWEDVEDTIDAAQVALANWSSREDASSRRWDLYVLVLLRHWPQTPQEGAAIEAAEANTELARKIVRSHVVDDDDLRRALRPLLPIIPVGRVAIPDVAVALEERLRVHGVDPDLVSSAVAGFLQSGAVRL
jgi:hypothetical protein